ncbi:MAG: hypothetical protein RIC53_16225 [Cyclobacteriaceae bacterium]
MKGIFIFCMFCLVIVFFSCQPKITDPLGSWTIDKINFIYTDTTYVLDTVYGGSLILSPERYSIVYNPWNLQRKPFQNLSNPTEAEMIHGFKTFAFNTGGYHWSGDTLTCHPDFAKVPGFEGGEQVYLYDEVASTLTMFDETYPSGEKPQWYGKLRIELWLTRE